MNFNKIIMVASAVVAGFVFFGCQSGYSDEELGLRKSTLFSEEQVLRSLIIMAR